MSTMREAALKEAIGNVDRYIDGLQHLVDWLVPELQHRGRFRTGYESTTLRGNLGID